MIFAVNAACLEFVTSERRSVINHCVTMVFHVKGIVLASRCYAEKWEDVLQLGKFTLLNKKERKNGSVSYNFV